jgi:hypothetical protein
MRATVNVPVLLIVFNRPERTRRMVRRGAGRGAAAAVHRRRWAAPPAPGRPGPPRAHPPALPGIVWFRGGRRHHRQGRLPAELARPMLAGLGVDPVEPYYPLAALLTH